MESFIKADIFFFISSMAAVALAVMGVALLFYLIKTAKNLYKLSETLKGDFKESEEFAAELKDRLEDNLVFRFFFPPSRKKRRAVSKDDSVKNNH